MCCDTQRACTSIIPRAKTSSNDRANLPVSESESEPPLPFSSSSYPGAMGVGGREREREREGEGEGSKKVHRSTTPQNSKEWRCDAEKQGKEREPPT
jgi:hypothetical protein